LCSLSGDRDLVLRCVTFDFDLVFVFADLCPLPFVSAIFFPPSLTRRDPDFLGEKRAATKIVERAGRANRTPDMTQQRRAIY